MAKGGMARQMKVSCDAAAADKRKAKRPSKRSGPPARAMEAARAVQLYLENLGLSVCKCASCEQEGMAEAIEESLRRSE